MTKLTLYLAPFLVLSLNAIADNKDYPDNPLTKDCPARVSQTNYLDVNALGRKKSAASHMSDMHLQMAKKGFEFVDMEVYTENGDLQGFYLIYIKKPAPGCN
jgi:hypothetical protein